MIRFLICSLLVFTFYSNALASHLAGGDITYKWMGGKKYHFTFQVYRDCKGLSFYSPYIKLFGVKAGKKSTPTILSVSRTAVNEISVLCPNASARCNPSNTMSSEGTEVHVFETDVDFAASPYKALIDSGYCDIRVSLEQCCRNGYISTLIPGNFYVECMLNICKTNYANSSPVFFQAPSLFIPCNQAFKTNLGGFDPQDQDSLLFALASPQNDFNSYEVYNGNFSQNFPMTPYCPSNPGQLTCKPVPNNYPPIGIYFNPFNGDMALTPTNCSEISVVSIRINEYRKINGNWELIGYVTRDLNFVVKSAVNDNEVPKLNINDKYLFKINEQTCFDIVTSDTTNSLSSNSNKGDVTSIKILNMPSGATFRYLDSSADNKTGRFCWKPHDSVYLKMKTISKILSLTIEIKDNYCQIPAVISKSTGLKIIQPDSTGNIIAYTYTDINRNGRLDQPDRGKQSKILIKDKNSSFSVDTDTSGIYKSILPKGNYRIEPFKHPYYNSVNGDTALTVIINKTHILDFPLQRKFGIYGRVYLDRNNNCIFDNNDLPIANTKVMADSLNMVAMTDNEGLYLLPITKPGAYKIKCLYNPDYLNIKCLFSNEINVTISKDTVWENNDFGVSINDNFTNISVSTSLGFMRRGQNTEFKVYCDNLGKKTMYDIDLNIPLPAHFDLKINNTKVANGGDTFKIHIDSLQRGQNLTYSYTSFIDTAHFKMNQTVCIDIFTDSLTLLHDSIKQNNKYKACGKVMYQFEPNEKLVTALEDKTALDTYTDYTVYFQNEGKDTAFNVTVTDTINEQYLNLKDFALIWSQASCRSYIVGNVIYFKFDQIKLPPKSLAGDKSISSFCFRLGLNSKTDHEKSFKNRVSVYYDFEAPVLTKHAIVNIISPFVVKDLSKKIVCGSEPLGINFTSKVGIQKDNEYYLELSNQFGDFKNPVVIRKKQSSATIDSFVFKLPDNLDGNYKLRITSSHPLLQGISDSGVVSLNIVSKPIYSYTSNMVSNKLCEKDTLSISLKSMFLHKILKNGTQINSFDTLKTYRFKLLLNDEFKILTTDSLQRCIDSQILNLEILPIPNPILEIEPIADTYCEGDTVTVKLSGAKDYNVYNGNSEIKKLIGQNTFQLPISINTNLWTLGKGNNGCINNSDTLSPNVALLPIKPVIKSLGNTLSIPYYKKINWYLTGVLQSDTGAVYYNAQSGIYSVKVSDFICSNVSDTYLHTKVSISNKYSSGILPILYPNPSSDYLIIECQDNRYDQYEVYDLKGQLIYKSQIKDMKFNIDVSSLSDGLYSIRLLNKNTSIVVYFNVLH